jgi:putative MATE family efflux protein
VIRRDLTKGSISKNVLSLALPMMAAFLLNTGFNIVDTIFVGRLSPLALAAISVTFPVVFVIIALASGIGIGVTSLIARLLGAKRKSEADNAAEHALLLAVVLSLVFAALGLTFSRPLFVLIGATPEMMPLVLEYVYIIFSGSFFMFLAFVGNSILRGEGDMRTPMKVMMLATAINIILDPFLIFGIGPFPRMEIGGAALATVIARSISAIVVMGHLLRGNANVRLDFRCFRFRFGIIKNIFSIGVPASLSHAIMSLGAFFLVRITSFFGPFAIAAYGLATRLNMVAFLPAVGISTAVTTIVGHNVGAKNFKRAERTTWTAVLLAMAFMEIVGVVFFLFPDFWIGIFTKSAGIVAYGSSYLRIVSLLYMSAGVSMVISAAFLGAGKGYPSLLLTALRFFVLAVPLAYFLSRTYGVTGIWYGIAVSMIVSAIVAAVWFQLGTWKRGKHVPVEERGVPVV